MKIKLLDFEKKFSNKELLNNVQLLLIIDLINIFIIVKEFDKGIFLFLLLFFFISFIIFPCNNKSKKN